LLDGQDSSEFASANDRGIALASVNVSSAGAVRSWFNNFGGEPTVSHTPGTGDYVITFPGLEGELVFTEVVPPGHAQRRR
jgi:hypothetical protein